MIDRFWLFHCGYMRLPRFAVVENGGWRMVRLPLLAGVAEHTEFGPVVFDAPFGREGPANIGSFLGALAQRSTIEFDEAWSIIPRIEQLGLRAADVSKILMTHLHFDHTGGMKTLAHGEFHLSEREWEFANADTVAHAASRGYSRGDFAALGDRVVLHEPIPHLADSKQGLDVLGDGSVEMFFLPGHTPGHCAYRIHLQDAPSVFFAGDAGFTVEEIRRSEGMGLMAKTVATGRGGCRVTKRAIRNHLAEHPDEILITSHDLELGARCIDDGPIAYDKETIASGGGIKTDIALG